jgi:hypothetical protein
MADVPLQVISDNSSSERRITPSWTISQLKSKLEFVTGVPPSSQRLSLKTNAGEIIPIEAADEDAVHLSSFPLVAYTELHVGCSPFHAGGPRKASKQLLCDGFVIGGSGGGLPTASWQMASAHVVR